MSQGNSCLLGLILQLAMKPHYKCIKEKIDVINYIDEIGIPISDINMGESLELECCSWDK